MIVWTKDDTIIPEYIFIGHAYGDPWVFTYYDKKKIKEELEKQAVEMFGYSEDSLYWDSDDGTWYLLSDEQKLTREEVERGNWNEIAYICAYKIEDVCEYIEELKKNGVEVIK